MKIVRHGDFYRVNFYYEASITKAIAKIQGRRWDEDNRCWWVPVAQEEKLSKFYDMYAYKSFALAPIHVGTIPPLPKLEQVIPLRRPTFPFQDDGIAYCLEHKRVFIGDKPGLGKTTQAIATCVAAGTWPVLIVCPSTLKDNWVAEWMIVAGKRAMILDDKNKDTWKLHYDTGVCDVFITNFESVKRFFVASINNTEERIDKKTKEKTTVKVPLKVRHIKMRETVKLFKMLIVDEMHRCKDPDTTWTKFLTALAWGKEWILGLSGTLVVNKVNDLIAPLFIIGRIAEFGGHLFFEERYCKTTAFAAELNYRLRTTCMYQRKKEDVLKDLPAKLRQKVFCDITTRSEYNVAVNDLAEYLRQYTQKTEPEIRKSLAGEIMVKIGICKKISARGKMNELREWIDENLNNQEKVVVFCHHIEMIDALKEFYPGALEISGRVDQKDRQPIIDRFQKDPRFRIIICTIKAGGVGITLTASSNLAMLELPWHAADSDQCEDRLHRIGQEDKVRAGYFIGKNTIDEFVYGLIEEKRAIADGATGSKDLTEEEIIDRLSASLFSGAFQLN